MLFIYIYVFFIGSAIASFLGVYVNRLLRGENFIFSRSHCENCHKTLKWYELIPVFSYIFQKGKCKNCKHEIGKDSLIYELLLGTMFLMSFIVYGFSYETLIGFVISSFFISVCMSDFKELIILDSSIVATIIILVILIVLNDGITGLYKSFLYGIFAFVLMFLVKIIGDYVFKRESLGGGDIKLSFITGMVLPYNLFLASLIIACIIAMPYALILTYKKKEVEVPFGPFLSFGLLLTFLLASQIEVVLKLFIIE